MTTDTTKEIVVNTETAGDQTHPRVLQNKNGVTCVIWATERRVTTIDGIEETFQAIKAQLFAIDGQRIGDEFFVTGSDMRIDDIGYAPGGIRLIQRYSDGAFAVVWYREDSRDIAVQLISETGALIGEPVITYIESGNATPRDKTNVRIAALVGGGFVLAWESDDHPAGLTGLQDDIYIQLLGDDLRPIGGLIKPFGVNGQVDRNQRVVGLSELNDGGFALGCYSTYTPITGTSAHGVYTATYDADGTFRRNYQRVLTSTASTGITLTPRNDGSFLTAINNSSTVKKTCILNADGTKRAENQITLPWLNPYHNTPAMADGRFGMITGTISTSHSSTEGISIYASDLSTLRDQYEYAVYTDQHETNPYLSSSNDGGLIAVWQSNTALDEQDPDGYSIMMRRFDADGNPVAFGAPYEGDYVPIGGEIITANPPGDGDTTGDGGSDSGDGTDSGDGGSNSGNGTDSGDGGSNSGNGSNSDGGGVSTCTTSDGKTITISISVPICC